MINLLEDIGKIVKGNDEYRFEIKIDSLSVTVYVIYDPEENYKNDMMIPVVYSVTDEFAYIPNDEFIGMFNCTDFGMDKSDIKIVYDLMEYFESNKKEIEKVCSMFEYPGKDAEEEDSKEPLNECDKKVNIDRRNFTMYSPYIIPKI